MKNEQLIKNLIKKGESEQLEFKEVVRKDNIARTICSFLNGKGGQVLVGVKNSGEVIGVKNALNVETELNKFLVKSIVPEAAITISLDQIGNKKIILVKVWSGSKQPYIFDGRIYFRRGSNTARATSNEISQLIYQRQQTEVRWERQSALGVDLDDLDEQVVRETLKDLQKSSRGKTFTDKETEEFLSYYGLYQNGNLTNAAVILFAKEPARFLPQTRVRLTVFKDDKAGDEFSYDRVFEGNVFRNVEEITQFFDVNIGIRSQFKDSSWKRIDKLYPKLALREGLLNALMHSDYSNVSGSVNVAFYPDRLEITNHGTFPPEIKPPDLRKNHGSFPRNPDIAHICFIRAWIEKIGRGTIKMINDCKEKEYPGPKWQSKSGVTNLIFPKITVIAKTDDGVSDGVSIVVNDGISGGVIDGVIDAVSDGVKGELIKVVNIILNNTGINAGEIANAIGKAKPTVERYIKVLRLIKIIEYKGAAKTGGYYLTEKTTRKLRR